MTVYLIAIPTACYALAAVAYWMQGNWQLGIVYCGYALANLGLIAIDLK